MFDMHKELLGTKRVASLLEATFSNIINVNRNYVI